jgi:methylmalonyl-CoA/ethylmalonyl-CoA epimerase
MKFHHTGIVVSSIDEFEKNLLFEEKLYEVFDPIQHAQLALFKNFGDSYIELIQPLDQNSITWNFLKKSGKYGIHHFCYEVPNYTVLEEVKKVFKLIPILGPIPALLFNDKQVVFFYSRNKTVVEFLIL